MDPESRKAEFSGRLAKFYVMFSLTVSILSERTGPVHVKLRLSL